MKAADLQEAQRLADDLAATRRILDRLDAGTALNVVLGSGAEASGLDLSATYLARLRRDIETGLRGRVEALAGQLLEMGVEP